MSGYIRLHRRIMVSPIWKQMSSDRLKLWLAILLRANYRASSVIMQDRSKLEIPPGSLLTSLEDLSEKSGLSIKQVRTALDYFEKSEMILSKRAYRGTVLTVVNWATYNPMPDEEGTSRAQTGQEVGTEWAPQGHLKGTNRALSEEVKEGEEGEEGNNLFSAAVGSDALFAIDSDKPRRSTVSKKTVWPKSEATRFFEERFWPAVWFKTAKADALKSWIRVIATADDAELAAQQAMLQGPIIMARARDQGSPQSTRQRG
jgi:hypothetical protein